MSDLSWVSHPLVIGALSSIATGAGLETYRYILQHRKDFAKRSAAGAAQIEVAEIEDNAQLRRDMQEEMKLLRGEMRAMARESDEWRRRYYSLLGIIRTAKTYEELQKRVDELMSRGE